MFCKIEVIKVLAVKGIYENGKVILEETPQIAMSEVVVVFPDNEIRKMSGELATDKKRELFEEFSGSNAFLGMCSVQKKQR